ncbi:MAG: hypothetical protein EXX96DRAFT_457274, partial [Benjaminiella poitrasii]
IRIACGQFLAVSILVEGYEVILINCIELYNHKSSLGPHYERFRSRYMICSGPSMSNKYSNINIMSKIEERVTDVFFFFNGLVTSSIQLDKKHSPEV